MTRVRTEYQLRFYDQFDVPRVWYYDRINSINPFNEALQILRDLDIEGTLIRVDHFDSYTKERVLAVKQCIDGEYHITK